MQEQTTEAYIRIARMNKGPRHCQYLQQRELLDKDLEISVKFQTECMCLSLVVLLT